MRLTGLASLKGLGLVASLLLAVAVLGWFAGSAWQRYEMTGSFAGADHVTDVSDPHGLAGIADRIFIGQVNSEVGTISVGELPETQFKVDVSEVLKGPDEAEVVVNQIAGMKDNGRFFSIEGESLLVPGHTYLFATMTHPNGQWQTAIDNFGTVEIESVEHRSKLIATFEDAVRDSLPPSYYWEE